MSRSARRLGPVLMPVLVPVLGPVLGLMLGLAPAGPLAAQGAAEPVAATEAAEYQLGPEDVLALRVVTWDEARASYQPMEGLAGEYRVSAGGTVSLPVVGRISASGLTLQALSEAVSAGLKAQAGLYQPPVVSLEIAAYRPFYISGDVTDPGAYAWRPRLTASKALALAGGLYRNGRGGAQAEGEQLREISSLRSVQVELVRLLARAARLEAELADAEAITFPPGLSHPDGAVAVERIKAEERAIFDLRAESFARAEASSEALIALHETELAGLNGKLEGHERQLAIMREQVERLRGLVERGTVVANRLVDAERTLTDLAAEELDFNTAIFRARQRIGETERDLLQARDNRGREVLTQLQETRRGIELATKREAMLIGLAAASGTRPVDLPVVTEMRVRRAGTRGTEVLSLGPDDPILPGDVLEISQTLPMIGN
ncbi:polysaccharide biosynthesis/export family protein [Limimaricola pyoseonensis]|uniref:Polysaccharide export outer membrane protein n=1 Tax=Limimaricola pyoseonensis TaxID=521013 RepID=A0A1G7J0J1_9RHOB|nr:polysaccharide biosynthesis/export family protein [Limimaricola pyoseonensis]SDF18450.1 polysaccharide export outer membrane protein [Limimaricola pyoseonensis]